MGTARWRALVVKVGLLVSGRRPGKDGHGPLPLRTLDFVAIDTETTGLDPRTDAVVALGAVPFVGGQPRPEAGWARLVDPGRPIPPVARAVHGIADDDVRGAPPLRAVWPEFLAVCGDHPLVAHAAHFDLLLLRRAAREGRWPMPPGPVLDIGALARALFPAWWDLSLDGLARLTEVVPVGRHTATGDALTAGLIFRRLVPFLERAGAGTLAAALRLQRRTTLVPDGPGATGGGLAGP